MTRFTKLAFLAAVLSGYPTTAQDSTFVGSKAGDERQVAGVKRTNCPT